MTDTTSERRADRFPIPLKVYCSFERMEGIATLVNISNSGALLEDTIMRPRIGTHIDLCAYLKPLSASKVATHFELAGVVVRHSSAVVAQPHHRAALHLAVTADRHHALDLDDAARRAAEAAASATQ